MKKHILLIIEDTVMALLIQEFLRDYGHEVVIANDGASGMGLVEKVIPDLIICCVRLSNARPLKLFNTLAKMEKTAKVGFISMGNLERSSEVTCPKYYRNLGVPFSIDDLLGTINSFA